MSEAMDNRKRRQNPPSMAPGMGDDDIWGVSTPGSSPNKGGSVFGNNGPGPGGPRPGGGPGGPGGSPFGGGPRPPMGGGPGGPGGSPFGGGPRPGGPGLGGGSPFGGPRPPMGGGPMGGGSPFGGPRPGGPFGGPPGLGGPMGGMQQGQQPQSAGEVASQALTQVGLAAGKNSWEFAKETQKAVKQHNASTMADMFANGIYTSGGVAAVGGVIWALSFVFPFLALGYYIFLGGAFSLMIDLLGMAVFQTIKASGDKNPALEEPSHSPFESPMAATPPVEDMWGDDEDDEEDDDDLDDLFGFEDDDEEDDIFGDDEFGDTVPNDANLDELMSEKLEITPGTQTREFLYEKYCLAMTSMNPDFADMEEFEEEDDFFEEMLETLEEAASVHSSANSEPVELLALSENDFVVKMIISRYNGLKVAKIAEEVANIYSRDEYGNVEKDGCFAVSTEFGDKAAITIYKGEAGIMVSLKDMYKSCSSFIKDPENLMPMVIGTSAEGKVQHVDFKRCTGLVVSGPPRMGKSWVSKLILNQLAMYMSPRDLEFYIGDPKDGISDFNDYDLPHVRKRAYTTDSILAMLRGIVNDERERRMKIFHDHKCKEIFDFRKRFPDQDMPFIYVVLDEMATLAATMEKDDLREYRSLLLKLVSQLPAYGIRGIFVAHRVKNEIIPKNVYELIPYRITVGASGDEVKDNLGLGSANEFSYELPAQGDMGVKISDLNKGTPGYVHAAVIAKNNVDLLAFENYIVKLWGDLEPDIKPIKEKDPDALEADDGFPVLDEGTRKAPAKNFGSPRTRTVDHEQLTPVGKKDFSKPSAPAAKKAEPLEPMPADFDSSLPDDDALDFMFGDDEGKDKEIKASSPFGGGKKSGGSKPSSNSHDDFWDDIINDDD